MINGELRSKIDRIWDDFWSGGISNPLSVIEQITYLLFIKRLDDIHTNREYTANMNGAVIEKPVFPADRPLLRWSRFKDLEARAMFENMTGHVFPFIKNLHTVVDSAYSLFMKDAMFIIPTPQLLEKVVTKINDLPLDKRDIKGDLYEYLLAKIATSGQNGQFRTPRHIIRMIVEMVNPQPDDIICDPASGTSGFLVEASEYLRNHYPEILLDEKHREHYNSHMFYGNDFDVTMLRIGAMNLLLHGVENPNLTQKDSLSDVNADNRLKYTVILANPPFKGSLDYGSVAADLLSAVHTKKTELLFLALFTGMLKIGGRCACIVPDGVLFGSSNAHKKVRQALLDKQKLQAVISMPSGVFKPYAGVSTAVLVFTRTDSGGTDNVWFYDMKADGFSLDDKRTPLDEAVHEKNNIPDILRRWRELETGKERQRTEQSFLVPIEEIRKKGYDLSINRYKELIHEEVSYAPPKKLIAEMKEIENKILDELKKLEGMLNV